LNEQIFNGPMARLYEYESHPLSDYGSIMEAVAQGVERQGR